MEDIVNGICFYSAFSAKLLLGILLTPGYQNWNIVYSKITFTFDLLSISIVTMDDFV